MADVRGPDLSKQDLLRAERRSRELEACVEVQTALVNLFKRGRHRRAFLVARAMLETVRAERDVACASLRKEQRAEEARRRSL